MSYKYISKIILLSVFIIFLLSSCSYYDSTIRTKSVINNIMSQEYTENDNKDKLFNEYLDETLNKFFNNYYGIDENILYNANIIPQNIDDNYTKYYNIYYKAMLDSLQNYISSNLKDKLSVGYYTTEVDLPRFVDINGNVIVDYNTIDKIEFNIVNFIDNNYKIQADVYLNVDVVDNDIFNNVYNYVLEEGYYKSNGNNFNESDIDQYNIKASYYLYYTEDNNKLLFNGIKENSRIFISEKKRHKKENNYFISRIPYNNINEYQIKIIEQFFNNFFGQNYDSMNYFKQIQNTSFDLVNNYYNDILLAKLLVLLSEENYKEKFPVSISPIRDNIIDIEKTDKISFRPYIDSSFIHQRYYVDIPTKVIYTDNTINDIIFTYIVELTNENNICRISSIRYVESK